MNKNYILVWVFLAPILFTTAYGQVPTAGFATWKDNKRAAYSIIHDDYSNYVTGIYQHAFPIARQRGVKICFGAITNFCGDLEWQQAREMIADGHECVNHSHNHRCGGTAGQCSGFQTYGTADFATELDLSTQIIQSNTRVNPRFFIHPYDAPSEAILTHLQGLGYLGTRAGSQLTINQNTFSDFMRLNFFVYDGTTTALNSLNTAVDEAIANGGYAVREFHGIDDGSWAAMTVANYTNHLNYVKSKMDDGSLWSATTTEAITYKMQRDAYQPTVSYDATTGIINVAFNSIRAINPSVLRTPVTVNVNLNGISGDYLASQNGIPVSASRQGNIVSFNVYPHQGSVTLTCTNCSNPPSDPANILNFRATPQYLAMGLTWAIPNANFDEVMIVAKAATSFSTQPAGTSYTPDSNFSGVGTDFEGGKVVYRGTGTSVIVTSLAAGTRYYFKAFSRLGTTWSNGVEVDAVPTGIVTPPPCAPDGQLIREYWNNINFLYSPSISFLTSNSRFPSSPSRRDILTEFRSSNQGDRYGERIVGYIVPKETGRYTFYLTGDDNTEFYLSTNENPTNKRRRCRVSGFTGETQFNKYSGQKSASITLQAGKYYYCEVLHVEGNGADHFGVFWQTPSNPAITLINKVFFSSTICTTALPSQLTASNSFAFTGRLEGDKAVLNWASKSTEPMDYYVIEKMDDATGDFRQLNIINADFKKETLQAFSYTDDNLVEGDNFYRVKTVYTSKSATVKDPLDYKLSEVIKVHYKKPDIYAVFPNPATDYFMIDLSDAQGKSVDVTIMTLLGKVVKQERIEYPSVSHQIDLDRLGSGQYLIRIQPQGKRIVMKKLTIVK